MNLIKVLSILFVLFNFHPLNTQTKPKLIWFDALANFERLCSKDSINYYLSKIKSLGFTHVVLDVKPITGEVLFNSKNAQPMFKWNGFTRDENFDILGYFIKKSHDLNLHLYASLNVFVEGHNYYNRGLVFTKFPDWQSINYTDSGLVPITKLKNKYSAMTNPANPEVQKYELKIIEELAKNYADLDGIILDRVRFDGIESDFSLLSKKLFEKYLNLKIKSYPDDIYKWKKDSTGRSFREEGKFYKKWLEWRSSVIYNFIKKARDLIKKINPDISFGVYAGAWYPVYYEVGVNWASKNFDPSQEFSWATENYKNYGYAELIDLFFAGCYFFEVTKDEVKRLNHTNIKRTEAAMGTEKEFWYSVEGSAEIAKKVIMDSVPVIAGLYVEQYKGHPEQFRRAIKMCLEKTDGLMIFDLVHLVNYNYWSIIEDEICK